MSEQTEIFRIEIEQSLAALTLEKGETLAASIQPTLFANLEVGRVHSFTEGRPERVRPYVTRVAEFYSVLSPYLLKVQVEKEDQTWTELLEKLRKWTYSCFTRRGFDPVYTRAEIVPGQATDAAIQILKARFPYDTDFDPWAFNIVKTTCLKCMRSNMKKSAVPLDRLVELDVKEENSFTDPAGKPDDISSEMYAALMVAIKQLPPARREVIIQKYFYEFSSEKIAENTHRSISAVYSLQFNAIENLRKILTN